MAAATYKCPNCGGGLIFQPETQKFKCEYCLSEFGEAQLEKMKTLESRETVQDGGDGAGQGAGDTETKAVLYTCPSCGAELVTDDTTAATFCYYCHNPVVLSGRLSGDYHPDSVIPFAIDRKKAEEIFDGWIRGKKYVPRDFYTKKQIEKLSGVYFPYWLYSCEVDGKLEGEGMNRKTWIMGQTQYTETQKFQVERQGSMKIEHVSRNALKKADPRLAEGVLPFQLDGLKPFSMAYLSGFQAEKRDQNRQELSQDVEAEVQGFAEASLKNSVGGYEQLDIHTQEAKIVNPVWNYALMPVWTLTYKDVRDGKTYYFALNGQTGKICGELPVDQKRLAGLFLKIFLPVAVALLIVGYFL